MFEKQFGALEDERTMALGNQVLDFRRHPGESIDSTLTRFALAQANADSVGAGLDNFHLTTTILFRALGIKVTHIQQIFLN